MSERIAKAKEVAGWATGDREVEAKGRVEQEVADPERPESDVTEEEVGREQRQVRREHDEYDGDTGAAGRIR
jgi:uncharacterized protein YjbJ (UPF0337 family)